MEYVFLRLISIVKNKHLPQIPVSLFAVDRSFLDLKNENVVLLSLEFIQITQQHYHKFIISNKNY
jgi:hypothetical protein